ncbi:hypothetical protein AVEN_95492-1, partial [Araneus ventricosus]
LRTISAMVKETSTQRKRRLEKAKQKRQEKLQQESEADKSARLSKRRKRAEEVPEKRRTCKWQGTNGSCQIDRDCGRTFLSNF